MATDLNASGTDSIARRRDTSTERNLYHKGSFRPGKILINREWTRISANERQLFASIRVHSRLILLARGCGSAALSVKNLSRHSEAEADLRILNSDFGFKNYRWYADAFGKGS